MASLPIELKDNLVVFSDPNLNFRSEDALSGIEALLVEGKEKTRAGSDFLEPKLYEGIEDASLGGDGTVAEVDGMMVGVGGSEFTPEVAETGKVNPEVVLSEDNAHLWSGLPTVIEDKTGLFPEEWVGGFFWKLGNSEEAAFGTAFMSEAEVLFFAAESAWTVTSRGANLKRRFPLSSVAWAEFVLSAWSGFLKESGPLAKLLLLFEERDFFQEVASLNSADFSLGVGKFLSKCSNIFWAICLECGGTDGTLTLELCGSLSATKNFEGLLVPPFSVLFFTPENNPSKALKFSTWGLFKVEW